MAEDSPARCEQCGNPVEAEDKFCGACGAAVLEPPSQAEQVIPRPLASARAPARGGQRLLLLVGILGALALLVVGGSALALTSFGFGSGLLGASEYPPRQSDGRGVDPSQPESGQETTRLWGPQGQTPESTRPLETSISSGPEGEGLVPPEDTTLTLTIPKAEGIENVAVPSVDTEDIDEEDPYNELANNVAVHLDETGFPWQEEANVYLVGHSLGFEGTPSRLALWDLIDLEEDDHIYLTDADGRRYTYRVYSARVVEEADLAPFQNSVEGKNILSIESFTLTEDSATDEQARYSDRRWVWQAELTEIALGGTTTPSSLPETTASSDLDGQSAEEVEAEVEEAAGDYYRAAGVEDWVYTYRNLDAETRSGFTEEEWFEKNQWLADNGEVIYNVDSVYRVGTSTEYFGVALTLAYEDGTSSTRETFFVYEDGEWKHRFSEEENDLFMPDATFEEFVEALGGSSSASPESQQSAPPFPDDTNGSAGEEM